MSCIPEYPFRTSFVQGLICTGYVKLKDSKTAQYASLGEEGAGLYVSRAFFICFARVVFVLFLCLLVSGVGCGLRLWHSLDFSINFFGVQKVCSNHSIALYSL